MALSKVTGQVINPTTDLTVGVATIGGGTSTTNLYVTGIVTAVTGSFSGNVSIGGTLTYEDVTNVDSVGLITARSGISVTGGDVKIGSGVTLSVDGHSYHTGVITATKYYGDGSTLTNITSTTINTNADNRVITGSGTADTLNGEANLTFDGNNLTQSIDAHSEGFYQTASGAHLIKNVVDSNRASANDTIHELVGRWNGKNVAGIQFSAGSDTTNKDDGYIVFKTSSADNISEKVRITSDGNVAINKTSSISAKLHIGDTGNNAALSQLIKLGNDSSNAGTGSQINLGAGNGVESTAACIAGFLDSDGGTSFIVKTAGTYANQGTVSEKLRISGIGSVGIGSMTPRAALDVDGHIVASGSIGQRGQFKNKIQNGCLRVQRKYQNSGFRGNYHNYGWITDRFQNRQGSSIQWTKQTDVPTGRGFEYSAQSSVANGAWATCLELDTDEKGKAGCYAINTKWCLSVWATAQVQLAGNHGFCQDLSNTNYVGWTNTSGSNDLRVCESAQGDWKRYYVVFDVGSATPHANNEFVALNVRFVSGSSPKWTGMQLEQVYSYDSKPSDFEFRDYATELAMCQRYCVTCENTRLINGYKRHDDDVAFSYFTPVSMYAKNSNTLGAYAWDYGTFTNMGGTLQSPAATAISCYEYDTNSRHTIIKLDTGYTGCSNCNIPSWESQQFEIYCTNGNF